MRANDRFTPFHPRRHDRTLQKLEDLHESYFPSNSEIGPVRSGYPEIVSHFKAHCSGGNRGRAGATERLFSPEIPTRTICDVREMWRVFIADFRTEVAQRLAEFGVREHGYSVEVIDVRYRSDTRSHRPGVFALVELRDGNLNPMLISGNCVESFYTAPVAYILSTDRDTGSRKVLPILTAMGIREAVLSLDASLNEGGISSLLRPIRPSIIFNSICEAIAKKVDGVSHIAGYVASSMNGQYDLLGNSLAHEEIAHSIRSINWLNKTPGMPTYDVQARINGRPRNFHVTVKRNYNLGTMVAFVR